MGKAILFSAPSGCGKSTIIKALMKYFDNFGFSVSATSRAKRDGEQDGVDYYFLDVADFKRKVSEDAFLEWEEVYEGTCYGTLKSEVQRLWDSGKIIIFDVDVNGGKNLKRAFGEQALSIFVMPPSVEVLEQRLRHRGTDSEESITKRLARSTQELQQAPLFDTTIINDDLDTAVQEARTAIEKFINA